MRSNRPGVSGERRRARGEGLAATLCPDECLTKIENRLTGLREWDGSDEADARTRTSCLTVASHVCPIAVPGALASAERRYQCYPVPDAGSAKSRAPGDGREMATLTDATVVTGQLLDRAQELRRQLDGGNTDFTTMVLLADEIADVADTLAGTFHEIEKILTFARFNHFASEPAREALVRPSEAQSSEAEALPAREQRRSWLTTVLRPARWLGQRLRDVWQFLSPRAPSQGPEFA